MYSSKIIADSYAVDSGIRLTSYEVTYPSNLHAEIVSNRHLSVTAAGGNVQRPMSTTRAVITGTHIAFSQFFRRYPVRPGDGPMWALYALVDSMRDQLRTQEPAVLGPGDWHLPYIDKATLEDACLVAIDKAEQMDAVAHGLAVTMLCRMLSVARCFNAAMVHPPFPMQRSYHAQRMEFYANEIDVYKRLLSDLPAYGSAFEHQATPDFRTPISEVWATPQHHGNLPGWEQHRMMFIEAPLMIEKPTVTQEQHTHG